MPLQENINTLETYLDELESESLDINDAVTLYSKGVKLADKTLKLLEKSKLKIERLESLHE